MRSTSPPSEDYDPQMSPFEILKFGKNYRVKYSCYFAYETYLLLAKSEKEWGNTSSRTVRL